MYGFTHADLINNLERIADHCSNLAIAVLNMKMGHQDAHAYAEAVKSGNDPEFEKNFIEYSQKYSLDV
jgi:phosphate:Na+ symporter